MSYVICHMTYDQNLRDTLGRMQDQGASKEKRCAQAKEVREDILRRIQHSTIIEKVGDVELHPWQAETVRVLQSMAHSNPPTRFPGNGVLEYKCSR